MRIISQNGDYDLPYESTVLLRERDSNFWYIRAESSNLPFKGRVNIARYTSLETLNKELTRMHNQYARSQKGTSCEMYYTFSRDDEMKPF